MDQAIWNTIHGHFFQMTDPENDHIVSRLSYHSDLMLALISPLYLVWDSVNSILVLQTIVITLGAIPIYLLSKKILKSNFISLILGISYLLYPVLERVNIYDFHAVSFSIMLFLFTFLFLYEKKYFAAFIACLLCLITKEEIGFIVFLIGIYLFVFNKKRKWGIIFSLTGLVTSLFFILYLIPHFRPQNTAHFALIFYSKFGSDTPLKVLQGMLTHPFDLFKSILNYSSLVYLYELVIPVALFSIFSPIIFLLSSSEILINILSNNYYMKTIYLQYTSAIIPFVFLSAIYGIRFFIDEYSAFYDRVMKKILKINLFHIICIVIILSSAVSNIAWGILPWSINNLSYLQNAKEGTENIVKIENQIPAKYSISASNSIAPHFTHRRRIYLFPVRANNADFIIVLKGETFELVDKSVINMTIDYLLHNDKYNLVFNENNYYVFQKKSIKMKLKF